MSNNLPQPKNELMYKLASNVKSLFICLTAITSMMVLINNTSAQYTGGIGSGYDMAELECTVPVPVISSNAPICEGGTLTLSAIGNDDNPYPPEAIYAWEGPGGWTSDDAEPERTPVVAGDYTLVVSIMGCGSSIQSTHEVLVDPLPTVFNVTGGGSYCPGTAGTSIFLSGSEPDVGYELLFDDIPTGNILYGDGDELEFENVDWIGTFTIYAFNVNTSCSAMMNGSVEIDTYPVTNVTILVGGEYEEEFCEGEEVLIMSVGSFSYYKWYKDGEEIPGAVGVDYSNLSVSESGVYHLDATDANGCINSSNEIEITVYPLPVADIEALEATEFCDGGDVELHVNASGVGDLSYKWYLDGSPIDGFEGPEHASYFATVSGEYHAEVFDTNNGVSCSVETDVITVVVFDLPVVEITADNMTDDEIHLCEGDLIEVQLEATPGYYAYQWWKDGDIIAGAENNIYLATEAGTYAVVVTEQNIFDSDEYYCENLSQEVEIIVNPLPVVDIDYEGDSEICDGESLLLEATAGYEEYQWFYNGDILPGEELPEYFAEETGLYSVMVFDGICYNVSSEVEVIVNPLPEVEIVAEGYEELSIVEFCDGEEFEVLFTATPGFVEYVWFFNGLPVDDNGDGKQDDSFLATETGLYHVEVFDGNCYNTSNTIEIIYNDLPDVEITTDWEVELCSQELIAVPDDYDYYEWYIDGVLIEGENDAVLVARFTGEYVVWAMDENGCMGDSEPLSIVLPDRPIADAGEDQTIDYNTSTTLSAEDGGADPTNYTYSWEPAELLVDANVQNPETINLTETTTFTLTVLDLDSDCDNFDEVTVFVNPQTFVLTIDVITDEEGSVEVRVDDVLLSEPYIIEAGKEVELTAIATPDTESTEFFFINFVIDGDDIDDNPYVFTISEDTHVVANFGHEEINFVDEIKENLFLYPNPARDNINISWDNADNNIVINIINSRGQLVKTIDVKETNGSLEETIDLSGWQKGIYFIRIAGESGVINKSFVVQ